MYLKRKFIYEYIKTYFRGSEIAELMEEDMPMVYYSETGV